MEHVASVTRKDLFTACMTVLVSLTLGVDVAPAQESPYHEAPVTLCPISGSMAVSVDTDSNGNLYAAVLSQEHNGTIVKCSPGGALLWEIRYDGTNKNPPTENLRHETDGIGALVVDHADQVYVTGEVYSAGTMHDCRTKKISSDGDVIWERGYDYMSFAAPFGISGPDLCQDIDIDEARGHVIVGGLAAGPQANDNYAGLLLKYDLDGNLLGWRANCHYALPCMTQYTDVSISPYNGVIYALSRYDLNARQLSKLRSGNLTPIDGYAFPPSSSFVATAIAADHWGNVFVGGSDTALDAESVTHVYHKIALYNQPDGRMGEYCSASVPDDLDEGDGCHVIGEELACPEAGDSIWAMTLLPDFQENHVLVTGSENLDSGSVIRTMEYDYDCRPRWEEPMDYDAGGDTNRGRAIAVDAEGNLIVAGQTETGGVWNPVILKYGLRCETYTDMASCWAADSGCQWVGLPENGSCIEYW